VRPGALVLRGHLEDQAQEQDEEEEEDEEEEDRGSYCLTELGAPGPAMRRAGLVARSGTAGAAAPA